jgi:hypothetical protein
MENFVRMAESRIAEMKSQLDDMKQIQNHPVKTALKNAIKSLETKVAEIKTQLSELKKNIIDGAKNALAEFKSKGTAVLDRIAAFFQVKKGLQAIQNNAEKSMNNCDRAVAKIEVFATEYHGASRHMKNMIRVILGKEPISEKKSSGRLAGAVAAPYKAHKTVMNGLKNIADKAAANLERLEVSAEVKRSEKPKKPTLMEKLEANKVKAKQQSLEKSAQNQAKSKGVPEV